MGLSASTKLHSPRLWLIIAIASFLFLGVYLFLRPTPDDVMRPALDRLSKIRLQDRWSSPDLIKIRQLGSDAIPLLRSVLREKSSPSIRAQLWAKNKWPNLAKHLKFLPDARLLTERRWTACQVLETLGTTGRPAVPELIDVLNEADPQDANAVNMALGSIGIDADICERPDTTFEYNPTNFANYGIINLLGQFKPPSLHTIKVLHTALTNSAPGIQAIAAQSLGQLGTSSPEIIADLKNLQASTKNSSVTIAASTALWDLQKDPTTIDPVFKLLHSELDRYSPPRPTDGDGQGIDGTEEVFFRAAELFQKMQFSGPTKARALSILQEFAEQKNKRIFVRMLLLYPMIDLGYPTQKCITVCVQAFAVRKTTTGCKPLGYSRSSPKNVPLVTSKKTTSFATKK